MAWKPKLAVSLQMSLISKCAYSTNTGKNIEGAKTYFGAEDCGDRRSADWAYSARPEASLHSCFLQPHLFHSSIFDPSIVQASSKSEHNSSHGDGNCTIKGQELVIHRSFVNAVLHGFKILWDSTLEILWDSWRKFPAKIPVIITFFHRAQNDLGTQTLPVNGLAFSKHWEKYVYTQEDIAPATRRGLSPWLF